LFFPRFKFGFMPAFWPCGKTQRLLTFISTIMFRFSAKNAGEFRMQVAPALSTSLQKANKIRDALFGFIAGMAEWLMRKPGINNGLLV
jgi:hypothetical protein